MRLMDFTKALVACLFVVTYPAHSQSNQERYALQERCSKQAAATFKAEWGGNTVNSNGGQIRASYQNHYNERLNKCFYLEISTTYKRGAETFKTLRLFDINENREYATFAGTETQGDLICSIDEVHCSSEQEFLRLLDRYMKD